MSTSKTDYKKHVLLNFTGKRVLIEEEPGEEQYSSSMSLPSMGFAYVQREVIDERTYTFFKTLSAEVIGLPDSAPKVMYIVTKDVAELCSAHRYDLVTPWPVLDDRFDVLRCRDLTKLVIKGL